MATNKVQCGGVVKTREGTRLCKRLGNPDDTGKYLCHDHRPKLNYNLLPQKINDEPAKKINNKPGKSINDAKKINDEPIRNMVMLYKGNIHVIIIKVHLDKQGNFYSIKTIDGKPIETIRKHLQFLPQKHLWYVDDEPVSNKTQRILESGYERYISFNGPPIININSKTFDFEKKQHYFTINPTQVQPLCIFKKYGKLCRLKKDCDQFQKIMKMFNVKNSKIIHIDAVCNKGIKQRFDLAKRQLEEEGIAPNVSSLWHGTGLNIDPERVCLSKYGIDLTFSKKGNFGRGLYFASSPYCDYFEFSYKSSNKFKLILVDVLKGNHCNVGPASQKHLKREPSPEYHSWGGSHKMCKVPWVLAGVKDKNISAEALINNPDTLGYQTVVARTQYCNPRAIVTYVKL